MPVNAPMLSPSFRVAMVQSSESLWQLCEQDADYFSDRAKTRGRLCHPVLAPHADSILCSGDAVMFPDELRMLTGRIGVAFWPA